MGVVLDNLFDLNADRLELIKTGKRVENEFIGVNSGIMDQFAVRNGRGRTKRSCWTATHLNMKWFP